MSDFVDIGALWRVAAISAGFGVGVVGMYALGIAAISAPEGAAAVGPLRRGAAVACFAVCAAVIVVGVWVMLDK